MSIIEHPASMTDDPRPVGTQLKDARVTQGLSVEDLRTRTNIRPAVITALEHGDIRPSGGVVYARGHVRTLAQALGLDPDQLLAGFDASYAIDPADSSSPAAALLVDTDAPVVSLRPSSAQPRTRGPRWPIVLAAVLVVVIAIALIQLLLPATKHAGAPTSRLSPAPSAQLPPTKPAVKKAVPPPLVFPVPATGVTLRIELPASKSWVDAKDEQGLQLVQRVIGPFPTALDLHAAARLLVTFGDASAPAVSCNGRPLGVLGAAHQVVTLNLYRGSPQCPAG